MENVKRFCLYCREPPCAAVIQKNGHNEGIIQADAPLLTDLPTPQPEAIHPAVCTRSEVWKLFSFANITPTYASTKKMSLNLDYSLIIHTHAHTVNFTNNDIRRGIKKVSLFAKCPYNRSPIRMYVNPYFV